MVAGSAPPIFLAAPDDAGPRPGAEEDRPGLHRYDGTPSGTPHHQRRLLRRRHRTAEPARRAQDEPVADRARGGDDVRQRRQLGPAPRSARRAAAGRRPEMRAGPRAQRARGAPRAVVASAHAPGHTPRRTHRREPAAVDDGAIQRRLPGGGGGIACAAGMRRARLAGQRRVRQPVRRVRRRHAHARRSGSGCGADGRERHQAPLARARSAAPSVGRGRDPAIRRGDHRARKLLYEPDAHLPGPRRAGGHPAGARSGRPRDEPADRRTRHVGTSRRARRSGR